VLTLKSLIFSGIGRFVEEQTINFDNLGYLVQVEGVNNNTSGSSGAGKSTIFKALEFLFGLNNLPISVLQSRLTKEPLEVVGIFDFDGLPLKIQRGKKFLIDFNGEVTTGNAKLTEEKLDSIIGMSRDLFRKILHKRQNEGGFFLDMGATKIHEFLTNCLKLDTESKKLDVVNKKIEELEKSLVTSETILEASESAVKAYENSLKTLLPPKPPEQNETELLKIYEEEEKAQSCYKAAISSYQFELSELQLNRPKVTIEPFDRSEIVGIETYQSALRSQVNSLEGQEKDRQRAVLSKINDLKLECQGLRVAIANGTKATKEAQEIYLEIQKIKKAICPTCEQSWFTDSIKQKEEELTAKLYSYRKSVEEGLKAQRELAEKETILPELQNELKPQPVSSGPLLELIANNEFRLAELRAEEKAHQQKENEKNTALMAEYSKKETLLGLLHTAKIEEAKAKADIAVSKAATIRQEQKSYEKSLKDYKYSHEILKTKLEEQTSQVIQFSELIKKDKELLDISLEAKKAIKSYLSCSFEDALDSIGDTATKLIRGIPNMATATIQFEGLKETKEGKIKEEVNAVLSMDGEIGIPIKSLSGGERSSTDLAIDLAVIQFIEEQTGKGINVIVLDEPFTGLDTANIQEALEMLRTSNSNKKILLVDHNPLIAESIENKITVVRTGLTSRVEQK
jgi:DNA repair exonuclease SbcCD ATPase subunit